MDAVCFNVFVGIFCELGYQLKLRGQIARGGLTSTVTLNDEMSTECGSYVEVVQRK